MSLAAPLAVAVLVAGCSTDVQRFGYTGSVAPTASVAPVEAVETAPLGAPGYPGSSYQAGYTPPTAAAYTAPAGQGGSVTVGSGDTAYSIATRNGVTVEQLAAANGLSYPYNIRIGQQLVLPGGGAAGTAPVRLASADATAHTVAPGDTLYNISRRYGIGVDALAAANGLDDTGSIRLGQTLRIPGAGAPIAQGGPLEVAAETETEAESSRVLTARTVDAEEAAQAESAGRLAALGEAAVADEIEPAAVAEASTGHFRWPVRGRIISHYGIGADGQRNDGINIAVPEGASVKAAEGGVVAYAGDELEGYGNLILIRHANDWVTAYAHNSTLLVERGETVQRGQIIAKAGQTGSVDMPQVHFEVRQGSKAVDPMPYLDGA